HLRSEAMPRFRSAGQVTGIADYGKLAAVVLLAGVFATAKRFGRAATPPPATTALGALIGHITGGHLEGGAGSFQPMNINYGLLPPLEEPQAKRRADGSRIGAKERGRSKKLAMGERALADLARWAGEPAAAAAE